MPVKNCIDTLWWIWSVLYPFSVMHRVLDPSFLHHSLWVNICGMCVHLSSNFTLAPHKTHCSHYFQCIELIFSYFSKFKFLFYHHTQDAQNLLCFTFSFVLAPNSTRLIGWKWDKRRLGPNTHSGCLFPWCHWVPWKETLEGSMHIVTQPMLWSETLKLIEK